MKDLTEVLERLKELGKTRREKRGHLRTGITGLDHLLDGGLPRGRVTQFYGPAGSGKSATIGKILGYIGENSPETCALVDADHSAESVGAFCGSLARLQDSILVHEPRTSVEAADVAVALVGAADVVVVDSMGWFEHSGVCPIVTVLERLAKAADAHGTIVVVTNHVRVDIRRGKQKSFGGFWARYHSHAILKFSGTPLYSAGNRCGIVVQAMLEKPPRADMYAHWKLAHPTTEKL